MLIPVNPDEETRELYVNNILATWNSATYDQLIRGQRWYSGARQLAEMVADGNVVAGAGVIAALSANKSWGENTKLATRAFVDGRPSGHVGDALRKAARIMAGESPESVLPMSSKTGNFYRCIVNPTDPEAVCIDRHAHDVAVGERYGNQERGLGAKRRYDLLVQCYHEAARRLGVIPQVVQAVTWVVWTESREVAK